MIGFLEANRQLVFDGLVNGAVYGMLAMAIVLIFRSSRVINFAAGNMGLPGAGLLALLTLRWDVPFWLSAVAALAVGVVFAVVVEVGIVQRLFTAPRVIVLVATIGVAQIAQGILFAYPDVGGGIGTRYPTAIDRTFSDVGGLFITGAQLSAVIAAPLVAVGLMLLMDRTAFGRTVTATAANPDLSRISGISPKRVSLTIWLVAGVVSTIAVVLLSADRSVSGLETVGPSTMANALAAAALARMRSFSGSLLSGIAVGVAFSLVKFNYPTEAGLYEFVLLLAVLVAVAVQGRSGEDAPGRFSFNPKTRPIPQSLQSIWWVRNLTAIALALAAVAALLLPVVVTTPSRQITYATIVAFAICAVSVTIITGWAGQLSLGQMAFAGVGAVSAAAAQRGFEIDVGWRDTRIVDFQAAGVPFVVAVLVGAAVAGLFAAVVGAGALRVRGLLLAVSTFVLGLATQQYLFRRPIFSDGNTTSVPFRRGNLFGLDLDNQRIYYWLLVAVLVLVLVVAARVRRSGTGRAVQALRDNPDNALAYGIAPVRTKLRAFGMAGSVAGLGGALLAGVIQQVPLTGRFFGTTDSLRVVSIAIIGGISSVVGPVIGALWVIGLPAFVPGNRIVFLLTSGAGLLILLLYFPAGLVQVAFSARDRLMAWLQTRRPTPETKQVHSAAAALGAPRAMAPTQPALVASGVTVSFGGRIAVNHADVAVAAGETVGLIGTNGAGKTTFMNAVGGFVASEGNISLYGDPVEGLSASQRARRGLGRTFQTATLFPELTVRETVLVAAVGCHDTSIAAAVFGAPSSSRRERAARRQVDELIDFLGLGRYADIHIGDLSTGTRRIVELAGLLAFDAKLLCLDEPTAGIAQREAEAFGPLIAEIRSHLGAAVLVVEHDMGLIMSISDRVYCLEAGEVIAQGAPQEIRTNPLVVASYLGQDTRAVNRSDSRPSSPSD